MKYDFSDVSNKEFSLIVDLWVKDKRARSILKDRFIDGMTFDELSEKYNLSSRQIKRIVYRHGDRVLFKLKSSHYDGTFTTL